MHVRMRVWPAAIPWKVVVVLMMLVMDVAMRVCHRFMRVLVLAALGDVERNANGHECCSNPERC